MRNPFRKSRRCEKQGHDVDTWAIARLVGMAGYDPDRITVVCSHCGESMTVTELWS